jgi:hypothetical protein
MAHDVSLPDKDQELEDIDRRLFEIIYALRKKYPEESDFAILKLRAASEDVHNLRIKLATKENGQENK